MLRKKPTRTSLKNNCTAKMRLIDKEALHILDLEVLQHPSYFPDLAPTYFRLFRSLSNQLSGYSFESNLDHNKLP